MKIEQDIIEFNSNGVQNTVLAELKNVSLSEYRMLV